MALHHLLFRCPDCGNDPMVGVGDRASCAVCGSTYTRIRRGREIRVEDASGAAREERIDALLEKIEALGGAVSTATAEDGRLRRSAEVLMRTASEEEPLRFGGSVLGFVEHLSEGLPGRLHLEGGTLWFEGEGEGVGSWDLLDVRALQSASSAVQISPSGGGVVQFKFVSDSPYRWEALLKEALQRTYSRAGHGEIKEFQPRIVTR